MSNTTTGTGKSRIQTALLAAIAGLVALDVAHRFTEGQAPGATEPAAITAVAYQPEVPSIANPIDQRREMVSQLKSVDRRLAAIEAQLKGKIRVEVTNFPPPPKDSAKD